MWLVLWTSHKWGGKLWFWERSPVASSNSCLLIRSIRLLCSCFISVSTEPSFNNMESAVYSKLICWYVVDSSHWLFSTSPLSSCSSRAILNGSSNASPIRSRAWSALCQLRCTPTVWKTSIRHDMRLQALSPLSTLVVCIWYNSSTCSIHTCHYDKNQ